MFDLDYTQDDAAIDRWNDAALAAMRNQPCPANDADSLSGYAHGLDQRNVCVVMPARPEGYYHAPIGTYA